MSETFDPYLNWLGIRDSKRPPNHYRLLGIDLFESDPEIISVAADRQMAHVRKFQTGKHSAVSQRLLNEIAAAKLCLLNPAKKAEYDAGLRAEEAAHVSTAPPAVSIPSPPVWAAPPIAVPPESPTPLGVPESGGLPPQVGELPQSVVPPGGHAVWPPPGQRSGGLATGLTPDLGGAGSGASPASGYIGPTEAPPLAPPPPRYTASPATAAPPVPASPARPFYRQGELLVVIFLGALIIGLTAGLVWLRTQDSGQRRDVSAVEDNGSAVEIAGQQQQLPRPAQPLAAERPDHGSQPPPQTDPSAQPPSSRAPSSEPQSLTPPSSEPEPMGPSEPPDTSPPPGQPEPEPPPQPVPTESPEPQAPKSQPPESPPPSGMNQQPPVAPEPSLPPKGEPDHPSGSKPEAERLPIPSAEQQAKTQKEVRELLRKDYDLAGKDIKAKKALVAKLWKLARETTNDPVARFVLYCEARDEAAEAGEGGLFLQVIESLGRQYEVDELKMAAAALQRALRNMRDLSGQKAIVDAGVQLARRANARENYEAARALAETTRDIARKTRDPALIRRAAATWYEVEAYARLFADFSRAEAVLSEHPEDPQANFLAGRYFCFVRNQWQRGLPLLAKGSDQPLRDLAVAELDDTHSPERKVQLADRWRAAAEKADEMFQRFYYDRAIHWYRNALPGLSGIDRTRVEKQLEELKKQLAPK